MRLMEKERVIHELRPVRKVLYLWFFTKCLPPALAIAVISFVVVGWHAGMELLSEGGFLIAAAAVSAVVVALAVAILGLVYCEFLRRTYAYFVTNKRCVFCGGILRRIEHSVPYHKVTDVEVSQNIIERFLGIWRLSIFTPGTGSSAGPGYGPSQAEIIFVGLEDAHSPAHTISEILSRFAATGE